MIGCLRTRVCKQPIIALYFESENELKLYNLEAWLTPDIHDSELFPPEIGYTIYRRDRTSHKEGGVIFLINITTLQSQAKPEYNTDSEILGYWSTRTKVNSYLSQLVPIFGQLVP